MKFPGAIYESKARKYLAVYSFQHDVSVMLPPSFESAERVAHVSYSMGNKKGGIDVFLLRDDSLDFSGIVNLKKRISVNGREFRSDDLKSRSADFLRRDSLKDCDERYGIQAQIVENPKNVREEVLEIARADIVFYCGKKYARDRRTPRIEYVEKVTPVTELKRIIPEKILTGGKQIFVPTCELDANIDFGKGCISAWVPGENASFDGKNFVNFYSYPFGECDYCYAEDQHKSFPKSVYEFDLARLKKELKGECFLEFGKEKALGRPVKTLRFGKRTEPWAGFNSQEFIETLEAMTETRTRGVIPTKFLPFNPVVSELLRKTNSSIIYSIGFDEFELGACRHGCNNEFRIEQARKYHESGVNSNLYLLIVAHLPPGERETSILEFALKNSIPVQLLPMRFKRKDIASKVTGQDWGRLKESRAQLELPGLDEENRGGYKAKYGRLICQDINPQWLKMIGDNHGRIRMCHHDDRMAYCGTCFLNEGFIEETEKNKLERFGKRRKRKKTAIEKDVDFFGVKDSFS